VISVLTSIAGGKLIYDRYHDASKEVEERGRDVFEQHAIPRVAVELAADGIIILLLLLLLLHNTTERGLTTLSKLCWPEVKVDGKSVMWCGSYSRRHV